MLFVGCKGSGGSGESAASGGGGIFGRRKKEKLAEHAAELERQRAEREVGRVAAGGGLGDRSWGADAGRTIDGARERLPTFDPASAPRRNPDVHVPIDPARARALTYSKVPVGGPFIAMTFDDGPHPAHTPRLLDMLRQRNIRATFFVVGTNARRYPNIIKRMVAEGHEVANHTVNHVYVSKIAEATAREEVANCERAIIDACGVKPRLFRPPGGYISAKEKIWLKDDFGYSTIMWAVDPQDWKDRNSSIVTQRILRDTDPGDIVLAHDIHASTIAAMPATLDGLLSKGLRFVTVSQLIAMERSGGVADAGGTAIEAAPAPTGVSAEAPATLTPLEPVPLPGAESTEAAAAADR